MTLLREIEDAAVNSSVPLPDLLRKCKVLAARLKYPDFVTWVSRELNGYSKDELLPEYRQIEVGPAFGHFVDPYGRQVHNAQIPFSALPKNIRNEFKKIQFRESVSALASSLTAEGTFMRKWPPELLRLVAPVYEESTLVDAFQPIPLAKIEGILDTVRTRVLDFVLAIQTENPDAGETLPNAPAPLPLQSMTQYFNTTIVGGQANLGNTGSASIGDGNIATGRSSAGAQDGNLQELLAQLHAEALKLPEADRTEAIEVVKQIETHATKEKPDLNRVMQYLKLYTTVATIVSPTAQHLIQYFGALLSG